MFDLTLDEIVSSVQHGAAMGRITEQVIAARNVNNAADLLVQELVLVHQRERSNYNRVQHITQLVSRLQHITCH